MRTCKAHLKIVVACAALTILAGALLRPAPAAAAIVTVRITEVAQIDNFDDDLPVGPPNRADFFPQVFIAGVELGGSAFTIEGDDNPHPGNQWVFSRDVPVGTGVGLVPIGIIIIENDFDTPPDDPADLTQLPEQQGLSLLYDLQTGFWSDQAGGQSQSCSQGSGTNAAKVCFELSRQADADGDGLLDDWERFGLDADGVGGVDVDLPGMGAKPDHKDLFVEMDYELARPPSQAELRVVRDAFAQAPVDAGGIMNPDGQPGITLHIDTGNFIDPQGEEHGTNGTCGDGMNNDGDGAIDRADPDCRHGLNNLYTPTASEDSIGAGTCSDGIDNDGDNLRDGNDPDCLAGDTFVANPIAGLGGGNAVYLATSGEDAAGPDTCSDGVDNGGGDGADRTDQDCSNVLEFAFANAEDGAAAGTCVNGVDDGGGDGADAADPDCQGCLGAAFYAAKAGNFNRTARDRVFRYSIRGTTCGTAGGRGERGGNDFIETNGDGGTYMHELGHNLNLGHGGNTNENCKPNYISIMNYQYQVAIGGTDGVSQIDYAPGRTSAGRAQAPPSVLLRNLLPEMNPLDGSDLRNVMAFFRVRVPAGSEDGAGANTCGDGINNNPALDLVADANDPDCISNVQNPMGGVRRCVGGTNPGASCNAGTGCLGGGTCTFVGGTDWNGDNAFSFILSGAPQLDVDNALGLVPGAPCTGPSICADGQTPCAAATAATDCATAGLPCSPVTVLEGHDDWHAISLPFRQFGDSLDGAVNPVGERERLLTELLAYQRALNTTDLVLKKTDSPDPVIAGTPLVYTLTVTNAGPNPAFEVRLVDTLPAGTAYVSDSGGCTLGTGGVLTCNLGMLDVGQSVEITITVSASGAGILAAGGAITITNTATVENLRGPDANPTDNTVTADTQVIPRPLNLTKLTVSPTRHLPDGRIRIVGDFVLSPTTGDVLDVTQGASIRVIDDLTLDVLHTWTGAECVVLQSGIVRCQTRNRRFVIRFIPLGRSTGVVRVKATLARLDVRPPFLAPVRVLLAYGTSVRLDDIEECRATNSAGLFCSEP